MQDRGVRPERTGWRDERISQRHRRWGWDCPGVDLDFVFLEYDRGKAVAIVEYKHECAPPQHKTTPTYQALIDLGNRAGIPVFCARYADDFSWWKITSLNDLSVNLLPCRPEFSEMEWVRFLYRLRGYDPPASFDADEGVVL